MNFWTTNRRRKDKRQEEYKMLRRECGFQLMNKIKKEGNSEVEIRRLEVENELHKRRAQTFNDRKKDAMKQAKTTTSFAAVAMDFQKNIYLPNIPTNNVYYLRQLSMYSFNIHELAIQVCHFFTPTPNILLRKDPKKFVLSFLTT
ncbi:hypothetical protein NQ318_023583 [Aromia moschata]|uniref:Uncharacterized protein n=1 Tax=Aromia moschata TaxID=1265417 RepID=A0AAV8YP14_9CUCU|nr:hypothetical protein NQ318_023583 [Aromia moschata]